MSLEFFEPTPQEQELIDAIRMKRLDRVQACIDKGQFLNFVAGYFEERPLHLAAQANAPEIIAALVKGGARLDVCDQQGQTALFHATRHDATAAAEQLLALGADPNHVAHTGRTAIFSAAQNGCVAMIEILIAARADLNVADRGSTPLFYAVNNSHFDAAKALVAGGARVDVRNSNGETPAEVAQRKGGEFWRDALTARFLTAAQIAGEATGGVGENVAVLKPLRFKPPENGS